MITECPHCKKRFLVMENMFKSDDGNARCGACMKTFRVFDHLKDQGAGAGGLLVNPELAKKRSAARNNRTGAPASTLEQRDRGDGRIEPVLLGAGAAVEPSTLALQLEPDPIDMRAAPDSLWMRLRSWIPSLLGALLAVVLGWFIYLQWFEIQAEDLPENNLLQSAYRASCAVLRCAAPTVTDVVSRQLLVYSHPGKDDTLLVETVIVNLGDRARPFPGIRLQFSDLAGKVVASRVFEPAEYLAGELAGKRLLDPQSPVQLELEIVDPGASAVNYSLDLLPGRRTD